MSRGETFFWSDFLLTKCQSYFDMMCSRLLTEFFTEGFPPEQSKLGSKVTLKSPPSIT